MRTLDEITILIVNYRTAGLTARCVESIRSFYPSVKVHLIDNGSNDDSSEYIRRMSENHPEINCTINPTNRFHGPALDQGLRACRTPLALTLDSDTEITRCGLLERMITRIEKLDVYAVGRRVMMDWFGYETEDHTPLAFEYIHPACMLLRREVYFKLRPFFHHGSPSIRNMRQARRAGYQLVDFPVEEYLEHEGRGTCSQYGYGLGLRHSVEFVLHSALSRVYKMNGNIK